MDLKLTCNIKVNLPGGVVSAGDLYEILLIAEHAGATAIRFGNRQQLYFTIPHNRLDDLDLEMLKAELFYEVDEHRFPNILSSYVTDSIFNTESWLREGVYKDIFNLINFRPRLKINLVDSRQTFVPFFTGNFNFITADTSNYWYWYIRFPKTNQVYCWPSLVYSGDISSVSRIAEDVILTNKPLFYDQPEINQHQFYELVSKEITFATQPIKESLQVPEFQLPYYEGFNSYNNGKHWLGIYRRDELFSISLLKDICDACFKARIGQLYTTPWKSLIIKGINTTDIQHWRQILNKHRLNIRHAYNELNWQLENLSEESLELKRMLVRGLEEQDIRTFRLSFALKMYPKSGLMGAVIIKKMGEDKFDILHTRDFNPNSREYIQFSEGIAKCDLVSSLVTLCNYYYDLLTGDASSMETVVHEDAPVKDTTENVHIVYECRNCLTLYDKAFGDELNNVPPGTDFETIREYACPVCDAGKESFLPVVQKLTAIK